MSYNKFKVMMETLREDVSKFCRGEWTTVTIDEAETLAWALGMKAYSIFGSKRDDEKQFRMVVERFVRNEILRVGA